MLISRKVARNPHNADLAILFFFFSLSLLLPRSPSLSLALPRAPSLSLALISATSARMPCNQEFHE